MGSDEMARQERRPRRRRVLVALAMTLLVLLVLGGALGAFGSEQTPSPKAQASYAALVAAGREPAVAPRFHLPVPGCVCHSPDPVLQMQHSTRRLSDCGSCHSR
jgi:hypothetical protein